MRKFFSLITAALLMGFAFTSCGDDDEEDVKPNSNSNSDSTSINESQVLFQVSPEAQCFPSSNVYVYFDKVEGENVKYSWDFGDGQCVVWGSDSDVQDSFVHTYETWGDYTITLTVSDSISSYSATKSIKILPGLPTSIQAPAKYVDFAPFSMPLYPDVLYADSVKWDIYSESRSNLLTSMTVKIDEELNYVFDEPGLYLLDLTAYGPGGKSEGVLLRTDTVETYRVIEPEFSVPAIVMQPDFDVHFSVSQISGDDVSYIWDFGDEHTMTWEDNSYFVPEFTHVYDTWGDYTVTLTVVTSKFSVQSKKNIKILPAVPTALRSATGYHCAATGFGALVLDWDVLYADYITWTIKDAVEGVTLGNVEVNKNERSVFNFEQPDKTYLLYLTAYGPGAKDGRYLLTDTVYVH